MFASEWDVLYKCNFGVVLIIPYYTKHTSKHWSFEQHTQAKPSIASVRTGSSVVHRQCQVNVVVQCDTHTRALKPKHYLRTAGIVLNDNNSVRDEYSVVRWDSELNRDTMMQTPPPEAVKAREDDNRTPKTLP